MHHLLHGPKNYKRKTFFREIFENSLDFEPSEKIYEYLTTFGIDGRDDFFSKKCILTCLISSFISHYQYLMIEQTKDTQYQIVTYATEKIVTLLKVIYEEKNGADNSEVQQEYWQFMNETIKVSFVADYDEEKLKKYIDMLHLYSCLDSGKHPLFEYSNLNKAKAQANAVNLDAEAKQIMIKVFLDSTERVCEAHIQYTEQTMPHKTLLTGAGIAGASLLSGMPYLAAVIGVIDLAALSFYAARPYINPQLTKANRELFIRKGKEVIFRETGRRLDPKRSNADAAALSHGIRDTRNKVIEGRRFEKKIISAKKPGERAQEIYVPSYNGLDTAPTLTQSKKIKGKRTVVNNAEPQTTTSSTAQIQRQITLPADVDGILVEGRNNSLMLVQSSSDISEDDIQELTGEAGLRVARQSGQSGIKKGSNGLFEVKKRTTDQRITLSETKKGATILVDGVEQTVPVLTAERMGSKNKLRIS